MFMSSESFTDAATSSQSIGIVRKENESIKRLNTQVWQQGTCTYLACGVHVPSGNTMVLEISILWETAILVLQIASSHPSCPSICFPFCLTFIIFILFLGFVISKTRNSTTSQKPWKQHK
ncbi:unnamed protein product [Musa acuminata subsp. burmannicoides]